jgi:hypothetical protein
VNAFRTAWIYNDTATSPADALVCAWDNTTSINLADGESFTLDFGANVWTFT